MVDSLHFAIVGSRRRNSLADRTIVLNIIKQLIQDNPDKRIVIVSGGCPHGADAFAKEIAQALGLGYIEHPVPTHPPIKGRWDYAKRAYARNELVAVDGVNGMYALTHKDRTGGTENAIQYAINHGRKVFIVNDEGSIYEMGAVGTISNGEETDKT